MRLFLLECKKILTQKVNILLLLVITLLSFAMFYFNYTEEMQNEYQGTYYDDDGTEMTLAQRKEETYKAKEQWTGEMNAEWWNRLNIAYRDASERDDRKRIDFDQMDALYGKDWYEEYFQDHSKFYYEFELEQGIDVSGKRLLYPLETIKNNTIHDIADDVVLRLQWNYAGIMVEKRPWNNEGAYLTTMFSSYNNEPEDFSAFAYQNLTTEELNVLKDILNEREPFHYGNSKDTMLILNTLSFVGTLLMIWSIVISCNIFNKERKNQMLEVLSTCSKGRKSLFVNKVCAVGACGFFGYLFVLGTLLGYCALTDHFGDLDVNITEQLNMVSIFTYKEGLILSLLMILLGVLATCAIGCLISTWIKSTYRSMAATFAIMLVPAILPIWSRYDILLPSQFMQVRDVAIANFTIPLFDHVVFLWKLLPLVWIPVTIALILFAYMMQHRKQYVRI